MLLRAVGAVSLLLAAQAASAATTWECYVYNPVATVAAVKGVIRLIDTVKQQTNGELLINLHLGGSLPINATNITAAVADSVVQMGDDGFSTGNVPISAILRLPLLLQSDAELAKAMAILRPYLDQDYGKKGIVVLSQYSYPFQVLWGRKKITSIADIKGLKLRVTSVEQGEFIRRFGGVPLTIGTPDVAAALDRGVVDGALTASSGGGVTWHDLLKYRYGFPTSYVNSTVIVNQEAFEKLPAATQKIVHDAATEAAAWAIGDMNQQEDALTAQYGRDGMILTAATPEDIKLATEKLQPYWDEWAKAHGPEAIEVLGKIRAAVGR
ncbi:MAG TPA: TRAP transporter substrate-binding protein DctP [Acetobacteraceae bacterium]|jgi:TRAP-type C4-dicarboxylate transport system substrate-binding protein|nr:TRAP transporter substrate-binding protein DctP [Acetobacteraceae bacterium]